MKKLVNGVRVQMTDAEIAEVQAMWAEEEAKKTATQYKTDRLYAYPSIADQLDQIYHEGIDAWKETIAAVKAEYPKP